MLKKVTVLALAMIGLASCAGDPRQTPLTPDLLEDQQALSSISNRLEPAERADFNRYVLNRTVGSRVLPDQAALMPNGKDPATVAEAISLMRAIAKRNAEVQKLTDQRDAALKEIGASMDATSTSDIKAYNALVERYNTTNDTFGKQIKEAQAQPLAIGQ